MVAGTSSTYPHQPTIASPNRSQAGFSDAFIGSVMAERYRIGPLLPPEHTGGDRTADERDARQDDERQELGSGPRPRVLEALDARRRELADRLEKVREEH